ncbi:MAG: phosphate/phosphite/phosphonate ABC transporter substrate-binding protein, partial [Halodesulfurarchaeum sp.]
CMVHRRSFLKRAGVAGSIALTGLAGCTGGGGGGGGEPTTEQPTQQPFGDGVLNFYMSPSEPQDLMMKQYQPVKKYLTQEVHETKLTYAKNYTAVIESLGSGTGDVAETGPFAAALGVNAGKAEIALQRFAYGSWKYTSVIVTKKGSGINSLTDLKGKKIALADRLSASGSLFPLYMLKQAGLSIGNLPTGSDANADFTAQYAGGHAAAWEALGAGRVDAAGVGKFITVTGDDRTLADGYKYVKKYDGIPRAPILLSPQLSDSTQSEVVNALKDAPDWMYYGADGKKDTDKESDNPDDDLWFSNVRPATVETYQPVIDVAKDLGIKLSQLDTS